MTDTRQSHIHESIATERERDELRERIDRALTILAVTDRPPPAVVERAVAILRGDSLSSAPAGNSDTTATTDPRVSRPDLTDAHLLNGLRS